MVPVIIIRKVPPGDAGHPVCLDSPTDIHLELFKIVDTDIKHGSRSPPTRSMPDELFARRLNMRCIFLLAKSTLSSLHTPISSTAYGHRNT
jgi:hypothetical protein